MPKSDPEHLSHLLNTRIASSSISEWTLQSDLNSWLGTEFGSRFNRVIASGSRASRTANGGSATDFDFFGSISFQTDKTLKQLQDDTLQMLKTKTGVTAARLRDVACNFKYQGVSIDLTVGRLVNSFTQDHNIWTRRGDTWMQTNVAEHASHILQSQLTREIRLAKLLRDSKHGELPSFPLSLYVIKNGSPAGKSLEASLEAALEFLRDKIETAVIVDPANSGNKVSEKVTQGDKKAMSAIAREALNTKTWKDAFK